MSLTFIKFVNIVLLNYCNSVPLLNLGMQGFHAKGCARSTAFSVYKSRSYATSLSGTLWYKPEDTTKKSTVDRNALLHKYKHFFLMHTLIFC